MKQNYKVFDQTIELNTIDSNEGHQLHHELSIYPSGVSDKIDLVINYVSSFDDKKVISANPSVHSLLSDGFEYKMGPVSIRLFFVDQKISQVDFCIMHSGFIKSSINKALNIQFLNHKEAIGQWFHEYILIPLCLLNNDLGVVHSSAVRTKKGKTILFGGTGGVGKTSLEIAFCRNEGASFIADDISVVDSNGHVFPNLSFPKVYGYNMIGALDIKKAVFKGRSIVDKIFYYLHANLRGAQYVRRRVSPEVFYGKVETESSTIDAYLILARMDVSEISLEKITPKKANTLSDLVISREYGSFFDHLVWHEYNSSLNEFEPLTSYEKVIAKNSTISGSAFANVQNNYLVKIPKTIPHEDFKKQMVQKLNELSLL